MHLPFIAFTLAMTSTGLGLESVPYSQGAVAIPIVLGVGVLQLRHSLATSRGERPRHWPLTFLIITLLATVPAFLFSIFRWQTMQWFVIASAAMLLPSRLAAIAVAVDIVGWSSFSVWREVDYLEHSFTGVAMATWLFAYLGTVLLMGGGALYGAARLVRTIDELRDAKAELAALAVGRERLRISRDIHDLLGQTLSAVSLKGDLALRHLKRFDRPSAVVEIQSLTAVARSALHDIRDVAQDEHRVSLSSEVDGAATLLAAAGIRTQIEVSIRDLPLALDDLLGWALREGVTNVLRHSAATTCSISVVRHGGKVLLEIENDGAAAPSAEGQGLIGLAARAGVLSGSAQGRASGDGQFRLRVEVPEVAQ
jgi:two-component system sensor histidine kinase DesK